MADVDHSSGPLSFYELTMRYPDEASAIRYFEARRWPHGRTCIQCGSTDTYDTRTRGVPRPIYKCRKCGRRFSVTSGTVLSGTHLPLRAWLFAFHMVAGGKHGISTRQMARHLGITVKSAWHLTHRIRVTMRKDSQFFSGGIVESDETYIGGKRKGRGRGYRGNKIPVQLIVERKHEDKGPKSECTNECPGQIQSIALKPEAAKVDGRTVGANLRKHTDPETTRLMTDESPIYEQVGKSFKSHETVNHSQDEYARVDPESGRLISTNAAEGAAGNLKRQITGTHHSVSKKHLPLYLEEYDHKYNNRHLSDTEIAELAISNIGGRRLTLYQPTGGWGGNVESLWDHKQGEKPKHKTKRGSSKHVRTGKKKGTGGDGGGDGEGQGGMAP